MAKKMSFVPLGDRVLVKPSDTEGERKLASGIIIPPNADKEKLLTGTVVAVGPGKRNEALERVPLEVKEGDTVVFKKPWDDPLKLDGESYYVLSESDISLVQR